MLAKALNKFDEIYEKEPMSELVNRSEVFKKIIEYLQKQNSSFKDKGEKRTFTLIIDLLSNFIDINEFENVADMSEVEQEKKRNEQQELHQDFLNEKNTTLMVLTHLSDYHKMMSNSELFLPLIQLGIQLLTGGNRNVQKNFFSYFMNFTSSEVFFLKVSVIFRLIFT
jgi:metal-responsive CopG/Arc/MetJ family transcriptional regulator